MFVRRLIIALAVLTVGSTAVWAKPSVVLIGESRSATVWWVSAELQAMGFAVQSENATSSHTISALAIEHGAVAAVVAANDGALDIWLPKGSTRMKKVFSTTVHSTKDARLLVEALEVLRSRLAARGIHVTAPGATDDAEQPQPEFTVQLAGGVLLAPGGVSPTGQLTLEGGWFVRPWLQLHTLVSVPLGTAKVEAQEGSATLLPLSVGFGAQLFFGDLRQRLGGAIGGGVALALTQIKGEASPPLSGRSMWEISALPYLCSGIGVRVGWRISLRLNALLGLALPQTTVAFAGREAATWGQPLVQLTLGTGVWF